MRAHLAVHGISPVDAEDVIASTLAVGVPNKRHGSERVKAVGYHRGGRALTIVCEYSGPDSSLTPADYWLADDNRRQRKEVSEEGSEMTDDRIPNEASELDHLHEPKDGAAEWGDPIPATPCRDDGMSWFQFDSVPARSRRFEMPPRMATSRSSYEKQRSIPQLRNR